MALVYLPTFAVHLYGKLADKIDKYTSPMDPRGYKLANHWPLSDGMNISFDYKI